jgi:hypothetical protein
VHDISTTAATGLARQRLFLYVLARAGRCFLVLTYQKHDIDWQKKLRDGGANARRRQQQRLFALARRNAALPSDAPLPDALRLK